MSDSELKQYLKKRAEEDYIIISLSLSKSMAFLNELEWTYFTPGTPKNAELELILSPRIGVIALFPSTEMNRSGVSLLSHKHGLRPIRPLTRYDKLRYELEVAKTREDIDRFVFNVFDQVLAWIDQRYKLPSDIKSISLLPLAADSWTRLTGFPAEGQK